MRQTFRARRIHARAIFAQTANSLHSFILKGANAALIAAMTLALGGRFNGEFCRNT